MKKRNQSIYRLVILALLAAVAMVLSYVESILPPLMASVPGIKLGLSNVVIIFLLYRFGLTETIAVSFLKIVTVTLLFGNPVMFLYSAAGAFLSIAFMAVLKKLDFLSVIGISVTGGISHNLGQILMAMLLLNTVEIGYYMLVLAVTGTVSGIFVGLCAGLLIKKLPIDFH